ncbi:hypothetical protein D3C83_301970 [compost metagenome]
MFPVVLGDMRERDLDLQSDVVGEREEISAFDGDGGNSRLFPCKALHRFARFETEAALEVARREGSGRR